MRIEVVTSDRDRGFGDWETTVVLRRVGQTYEPETGQLSETYEDREVLAIAGEAGLAAIVGTAGQAGRFEQMLLVRSEDVAQESNLRAMRVVYAGEEYRIDDIEGCAQAGMLLLKCNRI